MEAAAAGRSGPKSSIPQGRCLIILPNTLQSSNRLAHVLCQGTWRRLLWALPPSTCHFLDDLR